MTKYEKLSTVLSGLALIAAILSPFISYRWLDPQLQAFRNRARLPVTGFPLKDNEESRGIFVVKILNVGELPSNEIRLVLNFEETRLSRYSPPDHSIVFDPLVPFEVAKKGEQDFILINRPLAPKDELQMFLKSMPSTITVSNEVGETSVVVTPYKLTVDTVKRLTNSK